MMDLKKSAIAAGLLVILAVFYFLDSAKKEDSKDEEYKSKNISTIKADEIDYIRVKNQNTSFTLNRDTASGSWTLILENKRELVPSQNAVDALLNSINRIETIENIGQVEQPEKFGLGSTATLLEYGNAQNRQRIIIGKKNPTDDGAYVSTGEKSPVYVVAPNIFDSTNKKLIDFRDRRLVQDTSGVIKNIKFSKNGKSLEIYSGSDERWRLKSSDGKRADSEKVSSFLNSISMAEIDDFIDPANAEAKPEQFKQSRTLQLEDSNGKTIRITLGSIFKKKSADPTAEKNEKYIYAKASNFDELLVLRAGLFTDVNPDISIWRDRNISTLSFDSIIDTNIKGPNEEVAFKRLAESKYQVYKPSEVKTSNLACSTLNTHLSDLKAVKILNIGKTAPSNTGFDQPYAVITSRTAPNDVKPDAKKGTYIFTIGSLKKTDSGENARYVKVNKQPDEIYLVKDEQLKEVIKTSFQLMDKRLTALSAEEIQSVSIKTRFNGESIEIELEKEDDRLVIDSPSEFEDKDVDDFVFQISGLSMMGTAKKDSPVVKHGFDSPFAKLSVATTDQNLTILIGNYLPGDLKDKIYVRMGNDDTVYITSSSIRKDIEDILK